MQAETESFEGLPGAELVVPGLRDLRAGVVSDEALLVLLAGPRLRRLGIDVPLRPEIERPVEHRLYERLEERLDAGAHSAYNALLRRIDSFAHALEALPPSGAGGGWEVGESDSHVRKRRA